MKLFVKEIAMIHSTLSDSHKSVRTCSPAAGGWAMSALIGALIGSLLPLASARAQMVPRAEHALHQNTGSGNYTAVRINIDSTEASGDEVHGRGLALRGQGFWPHWEGRIGVVIDRPVNPLKDSFVLAQPSQSAGLRVRSMHILSDYYVDGGFRATAGLLRGDTGQAWWGSSGNGGGLNLSMQRLDSLGLMSNLATPGNTQDAQTMPYVGAGYSNNLTVNGTPSAWRFNADLGVISTNASNLNRLNQVLQGDRTLDGLVRDMGLRPMVKVSVGYSF